MRLTSSLILLSLCITASGAPVTNLKPGSSAYLAVLYAAVQGFEKPKGIGVGTSMDVVRTAGDWAFVFDQLELTNARVIPAQKKVTIQFACLLFRSHGKWKSVRTVVGRSALKIITGDRYPVPSALLGS